MGEQEGEPVLYIVLQDSNGSAAKSGPQYARPMLQIVLTLMGVKVRYAHKITQRFFKLLDNWPKHGGETQLTENGDHRSGPAAAHNNSELGSLRGEFQPPSDRPQPHQILSQADARPSANGHGSRGAEARNLEDELEGELAGSNGWIGEQNGDCLSNGKVTSVEQLRTPSFHARLRKGKWLAGVPGPDADEHGAPEREAVGEGEQNVDRNGKHKVRDLVLCGGVAIGFTSVR